MLTPSNAPDEPEPAITLNLDRHGKPLTYATAKSGPDRLHWITTEVFANLGDDRVFIRRLRGRESEGVPENVVIVEESVGM
jgi:hypothetical protein